MTITNPLLLQNPIEKIDQIEPDYVKPAISQVLEENRAAIEALIQQPEFSWENLMLPLEKLENRLEKAWSPVSHLNSVCNSNELRDAYDAALALLTEYSTELGQHKGLFEATKALYDARESLQLSPTQCHILKHSLIGFKLSGLHLEEAEQKEFAKIQARLAELKSKFEQNILDATMSWTKNITDEKELSGLPETELAMLAAGAEAKGLQGYLVTLEFPSYLAIMTYADNRELREEVYRAFVTRASELGPDEGKFDNSEIMAETLKLKYAKAKLLGYDNYAELSLETKMAESPAQVVEFLEQLNDASHAQGEQEYETLKAFAQSQDSSNEKFEAWDAVYYSEKLKQQNYQISQSQLRPYFPVDKVIKGLFEITEHHFNVSFKPISGSALWHKEVKHFQIIRDDKAVAEFYLDLYARGHKRGGAWMDAYQGRFKLENGDVQIPVAYLTCNFAPPVKDKPALLTHDEVVTLFHEFGHGIHHMLTQIDELSAAGISNVPWDAVELPSQFMENFCYQPEVIAKLSEHYETGEPLPQELLDKLIAAKNFQSAMGMLRQLEFALFDMKIHMSEPLTIEQIQQVLNETRDQVAVIFPPEFNRFQHGFSHIFAGGYSAGYYSYKWAEVLSADAFSLFEEKGVMNVEAGARFRENILEKGGSAEPMDLFVAFRGRKPEVAPLLRHSGIQPA
ncbi:M3 family metallopeptidase [Aliikangiella coralliicola]|uniref:oligopeptidase A n=1 Tax=Aliikangiella coralliicola TaxID=2592383 RepID=A0A545UFF1_9GAMM|nr:M3 family metallopeptidase [Aliikangiella coralliicola]TQV88175.1 M3 family metallopeptidase [Aliikangiella coralliicola]